MALGDIWLAGPSGSCDNAGTCPNGPCGAGEITVCPDPWTDTAEYEFEYDPASGESVKIQGIPLSPGETAGFVRGVFSIEGKPFAYDVEYFRNAPGTPEPPNPPTDGSATFTISNVTPNASIMYSTTHCDDPLNPSATVDSFYNFSTLNGTYSYRGTTQRTSLGYFWGPYGPNPCQTQVSTPYYYRTYEVWRKTSDGDAVGPINGNKQGDILKLIDDPYGTPGQWFAGPHSAPYNDEEPYGTSGARCAFTATTIAGTSLAEWSGDVAWSGYTPPAPTPEVIDFLRWRVLAYPSPRQTLNNEATFEAIPLEASPGIAELQWGKNSFADQITLISNPTTAVAGTIRVTIRNACEAPPP